MSSHASIFAEASLDLDLRSFALKVFEILEIADFEERESSNYVDRYYFRHKARDLEIKVTYDDDSDRYRFWLPISSSNETATEIAQAYAKKLSAAGWPTFVPSAGWALKGWDGNGSRYDV